MLTALDDAGKCPLDYATYFCHADAAAYLRGLGEEGYRTEYEQRGLAATKIQKRARGNASRKDVLGLAHEAFK